MGRAVLANLVRMLDQFDAAVERGAAGRQTHVGASTELAATELAAVADEVVKIVNLMDGLNRFRFGNDPERLAAWESASNVQAAPRNGAGAGKPGTDVRPAE